MNRTTECVVDILRRSGPGALSANRLREELGRCRPPILITSDGLRYVVERSGGRLALLEISADDLGETVLDGWVVVMEREDAPSRSWLASMLWESLAALAEELDLGSRTDVARWILHAERAVRVCMAAGRFGLTGPRP